MLIHALFQGFLPLSVTGKRLARPKNGSGNLFDLCRSIVVAFPLGGETMGQARRRFCRTKVGDVIFLRPRKRGGVWSRGPYPRRQPPKVSGWDPGSRGEAALQVESIIRTGRGQGGTAGADSRQSHTALVLLVTLLQWMTTDKSSPMSPLPVLIRRGLSCNSKSAQCASSTTSRVRDAPAVGLRGIFMLGGFWNSNRIGESRQWLPYLLLAWGQFLDRTVCALY